MRFESWRPPVCCAVFRFLLSSLLTNFRSLALLQVGTFLCLFALSTSCVVCSRPRTRVFPTESDCGGSDLTRACESASSTLYTSGVRRSTSFGERARGQSSCLGRTRSPSWSSALHTLCMPSFFERRPRATVQARSA